ncbi:MAG: nickel pincer cofactor biosynthesis protein LarB [Clostridiales bacterium]|jgi:NCAIR mutase (PurE)-related protein|nr:nickel pincer cofactor biosynthesis protein LarB [Clostridiales bacterium]
MEQSELIKLLRGVKAGEIPEEDAAAALRAAVFPEASALPYADIDYHRALRKGAPEVIFGEGKTACQILGILSEMTGRGVKNIMATRLSPEKAEFLAARTRLTYYAEARIGVCEKTERELSGNIVVAAAGTSDIAVCEEAAVAAETLGSRVTRVYDVGVAGIHRLFRRLDELMAARVVVAVAGMEGALASVIGGLVSVPVIAVPTSVGYGANFGGLSALLSMLNSCASGVSVVNIDNGFGAGYLAHMINKNG